MATKKHLDTLCRLATDKLGQPVTLQRPKPGLWAIQIGEEPPTTYSNKAEAAAFLTGLIASRKHVRHA